MPSLSLYPQAPQSMANDLIQPSPHPARQVIILFDLF